MASARQRMRVGEQAELATGRIELVQFDYPGAAEYRYEGVDVVRLDLCLTPRQAGDTASYIGRWVTHRTAPLGSLVIFLAGQPLQIRSAGGLRRSVICELHADEVRRWLPDGFEVTDRRLEACLNVSCPEVATDMHRLAHELHGHALGWADVATRVTQNIAVGVARYLTGITDTDICGALAEWRLQVIERSATREGPPPRLDALADACHLSVRQLTRAFRLTRGCTIGEYLQRTRIEAAKRRLHAGESVKAVSDGLGFSSAANFCTAFRRATGHPPSSFRRRVQGAPDE